MNTLFAPEADSIMRSYMKSLWSQVHLTKEYSHGLRGQYERELDEARFSAILIKPVAKRSQRSRSPNANPR